MLNRRAFSLCITAVFLSGVTAVAHHGSNVSYQLDKTITLTGAVTEWEFVNPHPQIYFDVKNESGEVAHWAAELLPTPSMMKNMQVGWSRTTMKPQSSNEFSLGALTMD